ncbi:zf-HC2 domain-containing protein [Kutzneria viridogrisea]
MGAYVLGALAPEEARALEAHLQTCPECRHELTELRQLNELMGEVPPEAFLDGPPEGGDLLLRRTLREVRAQSARERTRRGLGAAAVFVLLVAVSVGAGVVVGRQGVGGVVAEPSSTAPTTQAPQAGAKTAAAVDSRTGAELTATVVPAKGWVRIQVQAAKIAAGQRCKLMVVSRAGQQVQFGGWLVGEQAWAKGVTLDGSALMSPDDVAAVSVVTEAGQTLVSVPIPV